MTNRINRVFRIALMLGIALIGPVVSLAFPLESQAMLSGCRTDPVITLSNGWVVDVYADINTNAANIKKVEYDVHVPAGVSMLSFVATPIAGLKDKETVVIVNNAPAGQYSASAVVKTTGNAKSATWTTTLVVLSKPASAPPLTASSRTATVHTARK